MNYKTMRALSVEWVIDASLFTGDVDILIELRNYWKFKTYKEEIVLLTVEELKNELPLVFQYFYIVSNSDLINEEWKDVKDEKVFILFKGDTWK